MTAEKQTFAPTYPRISKGELDNLIQFPRDVEYRAQWFVHWSEALEADHPAKANLFLTEELIKFCTPPGGTVMDINAGSGSVLIGLVHGFKVVAIEIAPHFYNWIRLSEDKIRDILLNQGSHFSSKKDLMVKALGIQDGHELIEPDIPIALIVNNNCESVLPFRGVDSIVFSPPYAGAMNSGGGILAREEQLMKGIEQYRDGDRMNLGNLSDFSYNRAMKKIYEKCFESLNPGGKLALLIKDRIVKGVRTELGLAAVQMMVSAGFELHTWERWAPPGTMFVNIHKSKGRKVIEDEHIIVMEKSE